MPLAHRRADVTVRLERLGNRDESIVKNGLIGDGLQLAERVVAAFWIADREDAVPRSVLTGHQTSAARSTVGSIRVGIGKDHALAGQSVDVRSLVILAAHEAEIGPPQVVDEKENDVGLVSGTHARAECNQEEQRSNQVSFHS